MSADRAAPRRERAAARLLDDERLRGDLTDDQYAPLLTWALAWVDAYAAATAGIDDEPAAGTALEPGIAWVRGQLAAVVELIESWDVTGTAERRSALAALAASCPAPGLAAGLDRVVGLLDADAAAPAIAALLPPAPAVDSGAGGG